MNVSFESGSPMENSAAGAPQVINEKIPIPFMPGYVVRIVGDEFCDVTGEYINEVHIWHEETLDTDTFTNAGFYKVMKFVKEQIIKHKVHKFVIRAEDRRHDVFRAWVLKNGFGMETLDENPWDEVGMEVFITPNDMMNYPEKYIQNDEQVQLAAADTVHMNPANFPSELNKAA